MSWAHSDAESDPTKRQILAATYLSLAIKVNNAVRTVTDSPLTLCSDKSFYAPCSEDVCKLLSSIISTSTSILKSQSTASAPAAPTAPPAKGGKAGAVDTSAGSSAPGKPTGRDALFALSSLLREADILRCDGYEYTHMADIHNSLSKNVPAYADSCCFKSLPSASISEFNVPASSYSCLWNLRGFSKNAITSSTVSSNASQVKKPENFKDGGLFDTFLGYFLVGAVAGSTRNQPLLTKIEIPFNTLIDLERDFMGLKIALITENPLASSSEGFAGAVREIFIRAYQALRFNGSSGDVEVSALYDAAKLKVTVRNRSNDKTCALEVTESLLGNCSKVFAHRLATQSCVDNAICAFLWFCMS
jgi:hypothetical protein